MGCREERRGQGFMHSMGTQARQCAVRVQCANCTFCVQCAVCTGCVYCADCIHVYVQTARHCTLLAPWTSSSPLILQGHLPLMKRRQSR